MWSKRLLVCIGVLGLLLYSYVDMQNAVTERRLKIPVLSKEIADLTAANTHLQYAIDLFESPEHLMQLACHSEYSHLKQPMLKEILTMQEGTSLTPSANDQQMAAEAGSNKVKFAIGAKLTGD